MGWRDYQMPISRDNDIPEDPPVLLTTLTEGDPETCCQDIPAPFGNCMEWDAKPCPLTDGPEPFCRDRQTWCWVVVKHRRTWTGKPAVVLSLDEIRERKGMMRTRREKTQSKEELR